MALQMPRLSWVIQAEQRVVERYIRDEKVDVLLSDNRYGCWSSKVRSIFLTHQLRPLIPNPILERVVHRGLEWWLSRFEEVWIPDQPPPQALAEKLHRGSKGPPLRYLGWLSRFQPLPPGDIEYTLAAILSGPEPQRTFLEEAILQQAASVHGKILLVRGRSSALPPKLHPSNVEVLGLVSGEGLAVRVRKSRHLLCRSGYSSLMDLKAMSRSALLVPTPGQTEQLYLANRARELKWCVVQNQEEVDLKSGLEQLEALSSSPHSTPPSPNWEPLLEVLGRS